MSATNRIADLLTVTDRLSDVLEREIAILRAHKPAELTSVQQTKAVLTAAYESHARALRSESDLLATAAPELRARLAASASRLETSLAANEQSLRAAKETAERVLRAIADEVERQRRDSLAYSANGNATSSQRAASRPPVSVAVDERF